MDLTQEIILQHGRFSPFKREIKNPTLSAEVENPLCGDALQIELKIAKGEVVDAGFSGAGCLISQAAASLLLEEAKKVKELKEIKKFDKEIVLKLLGIQLTPSRVQCAMLAVEALKKALKTNGFQIVGYPRRGY